MISLVNSAPECLSSEPELIKLRSAFEQYSDIALFWRQNEGDCFISLLDNNMVIYNILADVEELKEFIAVIAPGSIFTDSKTLSQLSLPAYEEAAVLYKACRKEKCPEGDELSSKEVYELLVGAGLKPSDYQHFAVDFCHRRNHGGLEAFGFRDNAVALAIISGEYALISGVASLKKGFGSRVLSGLCQRLAGKTAVVCCKEELKGFYLKNGFKSLDKKCVYWVRE